MKRHLRTSTKTLTRGISRDGERTTSLRLPHVLLVIIVLGGDDNLVSNQVSRVETNTKLPNHADISSSSQRLHKLLGARPSDGSKVVNQISLGHTDTTIDNGQGVVSLVGNDVDEKLRLAIELALIRQRLEPYLIQRL
ncbi:Uncharacterized protein Rs2_05864 [Raphanus sativus]|nr:Uncharacterized protein Rs2_05864 [Raphanus sativus]